MSSNCFFENIIYRSSKVRKNVYIMNICVKLLLTSKPPFGQHPVKLKMIFVVINTSACLQIQRLPTLYENRRKQPTKNLHSTLLCKYFISSPAQSSQRRRSRQQQQQAREKKKKKEQKHGDIPTLNHVRYVNSKVTFSA